MTSVGADAGQPNQNLCDDSLADSLEEYNRYFRQLNDPSYLPTVSMRELYETAYESKPPLIDGLLFPGTYLLVGAPKLGKSFLVAQLAYHVSTGTPLWNYPVRKGTVLYLALEDDNQRLQSRMYQMFDMEIADQLYFATRARQLGKGLDEQLERFVREHPDTRLIIIDTLQKVREIGGEAYPAEKLCRLPQFMPDPGASHSQAKSGRCVRYDLWHKWFARCSGWSVSSAETQAHRKRGHAGHFRQRPAGPEASSVSE